ncbi:MAG: tryptophan--tRNA ligase, partial [Actinomycetes bacterium]
MARPRVLSGIRPTGQSFQLGNYIGAVRHWAVMQDENECFFFLADLHALTETPEGDVLRTRTRQSVAELLAMGVDPQRSAVFAQSHLPEHAELAWVLGCLTGFGEASRMTQFKDKSATSSAGATVGLFTYPVLQAADILMYQADAVPIGEDQRQHLELTRDLAQRFNSRYGRTFTLPAPYTGRAGERIKDLQDPTRKMSK